jgi:hypothetical protein
VITSPAWAGPLQKKRNKKRGSKDALFSSSQQEGKGAISTSRVAASQKKDGRCTNPATLCSLTRGWSSAAHPPPALCSFNLLSDFCPGKASLLTTTTMKRKMKIRRSTRAREVPPPPWGPGRMGAMLPLLSLADKDLSARRRATKKETDDHATAGDANKLNARERAERLLPCALPSGWTDECRGSRVRPAMRVAQSLEPGHSSVVCFAAPPPPVL